MTNLASVVGQLKQERDRAAKELERLDAALAALNGNAYGKRAIGRPEGTRRKLSAKTLAAIRRGQKARRARERAEKKAAK